MFLVEQGEHWQTRQPLKKKSGSGLPHSKQSFL
jgi:hypothetical protein